MLGTLRTMTDTPQNTPQSIYNANAQLALTDEEVENLLRLLRRKEGNWVEWGKACQQLQKAGHSPQKIFEDTGFEPIQQNQITVAAQVYASLVAANATEATQAHFERKGSDILYEFRVLTHPERAAAADFVLEKSLDLDEASELAKAMKDASRLRNMPEGFTTHPGDAIAYQCWKLARQQSELQERSRLIAKGLRFAHSKTARQKIEQLLTDFTVTPARPAPRLPVYRLESEEEMPRLLPVVGKLPLTLADLQAVPLAEEIEPFRMVKFSGAGAWVPVPGWQVILAAEDPVGILANPDQLPSSNLNPAEEVLVVVDRAQREWDDSSYFAIAQEDQLQLQWFEEAPENITLLGKMILVLRPKRILDENVTKDFWQIDE